MRMTKETEHGGRPLSEAVAPTAITEAREMLSVFASVGAHHFDMTLKDERIKTPLIQLDGLAPANAERIREFSFAILETSRGNFQAWLAVADATEDTARQLKMVTGADVMRPIPSIVRRPIEVVP